MSDPISKFWMVYGMNQRGSTQRHYSKKAAESEAQRLAQHNPGVTFVVLASVDAFCAEQPVVGSVKIRKPTADDLIPF